MAGHLLSNPDLCLLTDEARRKFSQIKFVALGRKLGYYPGRFPRLFWGEQPPLSHLSGVGAVIFCHEIG